MINVLYIAVGEGGSDQALITLIKELKSKIRPYVTLGKLASQSTINKLKSENIPYSILNYDFFWYPSKKNLWNYITRPIYAFKLKNKKKFFTKQIIELSKQYKIDIIHTNSSAYQFGATAAQSLKIPHIWHLREYQSLDFGHSHAYSLPYLKKQLHKSGNFNIAITKGIYNFYLQSGNTFSLLNSYKDYLLRGGTFKLILAGNYSSKTKQKIDRLIGKYNIQNNITLKGALPTNQIYDLMNRATALIVPSPFEAFGLITAEAMFNKCLVIGKDTAGTKEQFDNGQKKYNKEIALRFTNEQQLATHLTDIEQKQIQQYTEIIERAYNYVSSLYSIENNAKQIERLYTSILRT